jgi:hypothetical protein
MIPEPYELVLLALAAFRVWKLVADDRILDRPRDWLIARMGGDSPRAVYWSDFLVCPWCAGFWITLAWWGAWYAWPDAVIVAVPWAISAVVGLLGSLYYSHLSGE